MSLASRFALLLDDAEEPFEKKTKAKKPSKVKNGTSSQSKKNTGQLNGSEKKQVKLTIEMKY